MDAQHPEREWQPGDPLFRPSSYSNYLFNYRVDHDGPDPGPDAARWPEAASSAHRLTEEVDAAFIARARIEWAAARGERAS